MTLMHYDEVNETIAAMHGTNHIVVVCRDENNDAMLYEIVPDGGEFPPGALCATWIDGVEQT